MDKVKDINELLIVKRAINILDCLNIDYDYNKIKKRVDICKEIVALFEDDLEIL